jgi:ATP-dependent exoDNAse (exonuclease V) alpha subunit
LDFLTVRGVQGRRRPPPVTRHDFDRVAAWMAGPQGLTERASSFTSRDVLRALCEQLPVGHRLKVGQLEACADEFLRSSLVVPLLQRDGRAAGTDVIRRRDGRTVHVRAAELRYSTPELLALEQRVVQEATRPTARDRAVVPDPVVNAVLARRPTISDEQATMVRRLSGSGEPVSVVVGRAGSGKTFALDAAREAWEQGGYRVLGAAIAGRAARELHDASGIQSSSVAALIRDLRLHGGLAPNSVLVLDEAGMVPTRQLAEILWHTTRAQAKLVLVGDHRQLPEMEAGGAFRGLVQRGAGIALTENRRQAAAWERQALDALRAGRPEEAMRAYAINNRVAVGASAGDVWASMVRDWWNATGSGDALMIALRRRDVEDLNRCARTLMREHGRLGEREIELAGGGFAAGDQVLLKRRDRRLGIENGDRGTVLDVHTDEARLDVRVRGRVIQLPRAYLEAPARRGLASVMHGYAATCHAAQGQTVGSCFVLGTDELYRE